MQWQMRAHSQDEQTATETAETATRMECQAKRQKYGRARVYTRRTMATSTKKIDTKE